MEERKLLTIKDMADRWQVDMSTIRRYVDNGQLTPCLGVPGVRFSPEHIQELEGVKLDEISPLMFKKLERENKLLRKECLKKDKYLREFQVMAAKYWSSTIDVELIDNSKKSL